MAKPSRKDNGYRVFTDLHIYQLKLARKAFEVEVLQNGYRIYTYEDIQRLKVIRSLKCGNYSLSAILRMLNKLSEYNEADINEVLNSPSENEDIISVCDKLIISLNLAIKNAEEILEMLYEMKRKYSNPPL